MLKGLDPVLSPELLYVLAQMGHGDEVVIADANFTAYTLAAGKPVIQLPGLGVARVVQAVLSIFPLDQMVNQPVAFMHVGQEPADFRSSLQREVIGWMSLQGLAQPDHCQSMERFAFYERVRSAYAIVQTGELQPYANFILKKGVIADAIAV